MRYIVKEKRASIELEQVKFIWGFVFCNKINALLYSCIKINADHSLWEILRLYILFWSCRFIAILPSEVRHVFF